MVTQARDETAIDDFAKAIGEWLLTQRFGAITPLAFDHSLWEPRDPVPGELPHVTIDLLVNDPPPPPPAWHELNKRLDLSLAEMEEWAQGKLWPRDDMDAVDAAARACAREIGIPEGITRGTPVRVRLFGRTEAEDRFPPLDD